MTPPRTVFTIEFYEDARGNEPVRRWATEDLDPSQQRALAAALEEVLAHLGVGVCATEFGKMLGGGLFELRIRQDAAQILARAGRRVESGGGPSRAKILLRVFCHAHGSRIVLLLGGYDKGRDPSPKRQQREIETARKRLREWKSRQRRS
jgi:hypothetical protein